MSKKKKGNDFHTVCYFIRMTFVTYWLTFLFHKLLRDKEVLVHEQNTGICKMKYTANCRKRPGNTVESRRSHMNHGYLTHNHASGVHENDR